MTSSKPKYQTVDQNFHAQTSGGEIVIPLTFKAGLYRRVVAQEDGVAQLAIVLQGLKLDKQLEIVDDLELQEAAELSSEYFSALGQHLGASAGK